MRIVLRATARADLARIFEHSVATFGELASRRYKDDIDEALTLLSRYPELGTVEARLRVDLRSYPVGEHRIYYELAGDRLAVLRVLHKRMEVWRRV